MTQPKIRLEKGQIWDPSAENATSQRKRALKRLIVDYEEQPMLKDGVVVFQKIMADGSLGDFDRMKYRGFLKWIETHHAIQIN